jgi:acetyl esterase/lipase
VIARVISVLLLATAAPAAELPLPPSIPPTPDGVARTTHTFKRVGDLEIKADVHRLDDREVRPVVVWIHGGALMNGGRDRISRQMHQLVRDGVIVVSIDYRLAPETKLPALVGDVEDAFKWVHARGPALFHADPSRIGVWGTSAGGYLTLTSGFRVKPRPQVLVSLYGYGDLIGDWYSKPSLHAAHNPRKIEEPEARAQVVGPPIANSVDRKGDIRIFYNFCRQNGLWPRAVSGWDPVREAEKFYPYMAVKNITPDYPPTFLAHGTLDTDVPYEQSVLVARELQRHGVRHEFVTLENTEHSFKDGDPAKVEATYQAAVAFTKKHLGVR